MLFEKLVEQHRVHLIVAHAVRFSFFIMHDQVGIHLLYFLRDEAKLLSAFGLDIRFVTEGYWPKRQQHLTRVAHGLNNLLETL